MLNNKRSETVLDINSEDMDEDDNGFQFFEQKKKHNVQTFGLHPLRDVS